MTERVVVTGVGLITPVGVDRATTWKNLVDGVSGIDYIQSFDPEGFDSRIAGEIPEFDPLERLERKASRRLDRFAQFACVASLEALEHARLDISKIDATRVAVLIGSGVGGIITLSKQFDVLRDKGPSRVNPFLIPMMLTDLAAGQVSMLIGAKGPNFATVSACATGSDSIGEAKAMIERGDADVAIAGGTEAGICPIAIAGFNACMALSKNNDDPQGASRPFDAERDGFVLGEGVGLVVLESIEHAMARGAEPLAELVGYGATSDAFHVTQPSPGGEGASRAMKIALKQAKMGPDEIDYINAHGTSTPLNDKTETDAMKDAFGDNIGKIPISSTKSMTGHLLGAAGGVEAVVAVMSIIKSAIPPTINLRNPDLDCDLDYTPNMVRRGVVRTAMSNSLGFGGHNASLIFRAFEE
ncbi:MAG: beta-ketoacyl-ACP synthase II [Chloroflexi bacterium]|nr:beta-ketoacyl-ACP synthase II [Chloroflexota bacterium]MCH7642012.1 beta-ketoacyl-ACP synthase II [Chloroflexota bacterium]